MELCLILKTEENEAIRLSISSQPTNAAPVHPADTPGYRLTAS